MAYPKAYRYNFSTHVLDGLQVTEAWDFPRDNGDRRGFDQTKAHILRQPSVAGATGLETQNLVIMMIITLSNKSGRYQFDAIFKGQKGPGMMDLHIDSDSQ